MYIYIYIYIYIVSVFLLKTAAFRGMGRTIHPTIPNSAATNKLYKFNILKVQAAEWPPQTNTHPLPSALR